MLRYCRNVLGLRGKIGVYGRSLGGLAASHLSKYVDMVVVDRSFANLDDVAELKFYGKSALLLYKIATCCWDSNSSKRFIDMNHGRIIKENGDEEEDEDRIRL